MTNNLTETGLNTVTALKSVFAAIYGFEPSGDLEDTGLQADLITDLQTQATPSQIDTLNIICIEAGLDHLVFG